MDAATKKAHKTAATMKWRHAHMEQARATDRARYARDREKRKAAAQAFREAHKEQHLAAAARWREANKERAEASTRRWRLANAPRKRATEHRREARKRGNGGSYTVLEWLALVAKWKRRCAYCGIEAILTVDHRIPVSRGGSSNIENLLPACRSCNSRKHDKTEDEFRAVLAA